MVKSGKKKKLNSSASRFLPSLGMTPKGGWYHANYLTTIMPMTGEYTTAPHAALDKVTCQQRAIRSENECKLVLYVHIPANGLSGPDRRQNQTRIVGIWGHPPNENTQWGPADRYQGVARFVLLRTIRFPFSERPCGLLGHFLQVYSTLFDAFVFAYICLWHTVYYLRHQKLNAN